MAQDGHPGEDMQDRASRGRDTWEPVHGGAEVGLQGRAPEDGRRAQCRELGDPHTGWAGDGHLGEGTGAGQP